MICKTIEKPTNGWAVAPNLLDYEKVCAGFSWDAAGANSTACRAAAG